MNDTYHDQYLIDALRSIVDLDASSTTVPRTADGDPYPGLLGMAQGIARAALDDVEMPQRATA